MDIALAVGHVTIEHLLDFGQRKRADFGIDILDRNADLIRAMTQQSQLR